MDYRCRQQGGADIPVCGEALTDTATTKRGPPDENTVSTYTKASTFADTASSDKTAGKPQSLNI